MVFICFFLMLFLLNSTRDFKKFVFVIMFFVLDYEMFGSFLRIIIYLYICWIVMFGLENDWILVILFFFRLFNVAAVFLRVGIVVFKFVLVFVFFFVICVELLMRFFFLFVVLVVLVLIFVVCFVMWFSKVLYFFVCCVTTICASLSFVCIVFILVFVCINLLRLLCKCLIEVLIDVCCVLSIVL